MDLLLKKIKKGDKDAFIEIINQHELYLYRIAKQVLKNDVDVADAIQETILSAYKNIHNLKHAKYFKSWLIKILLNKCYDILKNNKKVILLDDFNNTVVYSKVDTQLDDKLVLNNFLESLNTDQRLAINLYYIYGFNFKEIGEILDTNENTVKSRVLRARKKLKDLYAENEGGLSMYKDNIDYKIKEILSNNDNEIPEIVTMKKEEAFNKIYELDNDKKSTYINKKIISFLVSSLIIASPLIAIAQLGKEYKYIKSENYVAKSLEPIYALESPIYSKSNKNIKVTNFTIDTLYGNIRIWVEGENVKLLPKGELKIGNKKIDISTTDAESSENPNSTYMMSLYHGNLDYNPNDKIEYTAFLDDGSSHKIDIKLSEVKGVSNYEKLGPTDTNLKIPITGIIDEKEDELNVSFESKSLHDNIALLVQNQSIYSGIKLVDKNGTVVEGTTRYIHGALRFNNVSFDTSGLIKPFNIKIENVEVNPINEYISSDIISLDVPKENEVIRIDKKVVANKNSNYISEQNNIIYIETLKRNNLECEVTFSFPKNDKTSLKINSIYVNDANSSTSDRVHDIDNNSCTVKFKLNNLNQKKLNFKVNIDGYLITDEVWDYTIK